MQCRACFRSPIRYALHVQNRFVLLLQFEIWIRSFYGLICILNIGRIPHATTTIDLLQIKSTNRVRFPLSVYVFVYSRMWHTRDWRLGQQYKNRLHFVITFQLCSIACQIGVCFVPFIHRSIKTNFRRFFLLFRFKFFIST